MDSVLNKFATDLRNLNLAIDFWKKLHNKICKTPKTLTYDLNNYIKLDIIRHNGDKYYIDENNILYDMTYTIVGQLSDDMMIKF